MLNVRTRRAGTKYFDVNITVACDVKCELGLLSKEEMEFLRDCLKNATDDIEDCITMLEEI